MNTALRIAKSQMLVALLGAVVWGGLYGWWDAAAALCGGLLAAALTFYAAARTFGSATSDPQAMLRFFYRAQARKWALAIVLVGLAAVVFKGHYAPLATLFALAHGVYWIALRWK
jgi:ATP synthase protein I